MLVAGPIYIWKKAFFPRMEWTSRINYWSCQHRGLQACLEGPGARFSKVPIINGPVKLLLFTCKIEVSIVLHLTWQNYQLMKQNVVVARQVPRFYSLYLDVNICFRARKVTGTFEKRAPGQAPLNIWTFFIFISPAQIHGTNFYATQHEHSTYLLKMGRTVLCKSDI